MDYALGCFVGYRVWYIWITTLFGELFSIHG